MRKITNEISDSAKKSLLARTLTAVVIAIVCIPCLVFGGWYYFCLGLFLAIASGYEIVKVTKLKGIFKILVYFLTIVFLVGIIYYCMFSRNRDSFDKMTIVNFFKQDTSLTSTFSDISLSIMLITLMTAVYFVISFTYEPFSIQYVFYFVTTIIVIAIGIQSLYFLRYAPLTYFSVGNDGKINSDTMHKLVESNSFMYGQSSFLLIYVIIGVVLNDVGAYFIGMFFGKHKMNERISPKKTWEGFVGGVVFSIISSTMFALICGLVKKPILPIFDLSHLYFVIIISILIPIIADIGDFVFSAIKRNYGVKDFSHLLPGHGGILDRIDSLLFAAALVSCLIIFINLVINGDIGALIEKYGSRM